MLRLPIVTPCEASWEAMAPARDGRRCATCDRDVHDFSRMTEARARAHVVLFGGERLCGRVTYGPDGAPLFRPEPSTPAGRAVPAAVRKAAAAAMIAAASGCAEAPPPPPAPPAPRVLAIAAPDVASAAIPPEPPALDTDADGIADAVDACPHEPGVRNDDPSKNGCTFVGVIVGSIQVIEKVQFSRGTALVRGENARLLEEVAKVLEQHPEIKKLRVAGHSSGDEQDPKRLSEKRARAVVDALTKNGVDASRLLPSGYGAERPLAPETTAEGRTKNRRVEFEILDEPPTSL